MGYTTDFKGMFDLNKPLDHATYKFLIALNETRRMARNVEGYGVEGEFFFDESNFGQNRNSNIIDYNRPPSTQPGLWCQWRPTQNRKGIKWDEGEKFYNYIEWLQYIIDNFLKEKGYILNGSVNWQGERNEDIGTIQVIENNIVIH